ncbi:MAG: type I secretion C-terminal target domain-containing protein, partial [Alphaproteobacteria bacterium]|nr:type I secretion C-terminal target domain-containing protein [Alphaproteobacteria bacterium]
GDGDYVVTAQSTDAAGNESALSAGFDVTVDTVAPLINLTLDDNVLSLNAPDHTFETSATENYFHISAGSDVKTTTVMSFNNGSNVVFNSSGFTDVTSNEGSKMLGLIAHGKSQSQIETDLGVASGTFDTIDPDGPGPKGTLNVTNGSYAQTVFYAKAGDVIKFDWNFLGSETSFYENDFNDVVFVVINGVVTELTRSSDISGPAANGWETFSYTATEEGPVKISFALFNVRDDTVDSGFALDNFRINDAPVEKQPVELNINLTVTDETAIDSNDVLITISGVGSTSVLSAGTNMGGGVWELGIGDLEGLTLSPPDAAKPGYTGVETLTITVQATDGAGNTTTVTETQNIQFEILDNAIIGTSDDDNIHALAAHDNYYLSGGEGDDTLNGKKGNDFLDGGQGNDDLRGGDGRDILLGGKGNDILKGGDGDDVYLWLEGDGGTIATPATDTITDFHNSLFSGTEDDRIDLSDLLSAESHETLTDYLFVEFTGGDSKLYINTTGAIDGTAGHNADQVIVVENIDLTNGVATQSDIINTLVNNNVIITDSTDSVSVV